MATIFAVGYAFMATLAALLSTALFFAPDRMQALLTALVQGRWLRQWRESVVQLAADLRQASKDLRTMSWSRWTAAAGATGVSWTARFSP